MSTGFDAHASEYSAFEADPSAQVQRARVHALLAALLPPRARVLDVGCGTGVDAALLTRAGHAVHGVDPSEVMLALARARCPEATFSRADAAHDPLPEGPFDAALSNFGALNCAPLAPVARAVADRLPTGAPFVLVLIARWSPAEILAFLARGRPRDALRRLRPTANVGGARLPFHAPTSRAVREALAPWFDLERQEGLGVVLPVPGPLGRPFHPLARWLAPLDQRSGRRLRGVGDHVAYVFRRR